MEFLFYMIFLQLYFKGIFSFLNQIEIKITLDLIKELEIRQCALVGSYENLTSVVKRFSLANIPVMYLNYNEVTDYVDGTEKAYFHVALILKDEDLCNLKEISRNLERENRSYKFQNFVWLIFANSTQKLQMKNLIIPYDCELIIIQSENETTYKLQEIYTIKKRHFSIYFGLWDRDFGLKAPNVSFYRRRLNFQKSEMRILSSTSNFVPWNETITEKFNEIIDGLAYKMNIKIRRDVRNSLYEAVGEVTKVGDALDVFCPFDNGYTHADKMGPIAKLTVNWYMKYPRTELRSDYYLQPFHIYLWLILLSCILLGTILILTTQILIENKKRFLIDHLFLGLESFCNQCGNDDIENDYLRWICILLRSVALISAALYGAVITSFFAVEIFQPPFTNVEGFLANGKHQLIVQEYESQFIQLVLGETAQKKLNQNFTKSIRVQDYQEILEEICHGKYVATNWNDDISHYKSPCKIYKIPEPFGTRWLGMVLQKHSIFTKIFQENLIRFSEIGFQMRSRIMANNISPEVIEDDSIKEITMEQMTQVLSIPFIGILLGTAIMITEIVIQRFLRKTREKAIDFLQEQPSNQII